MLEQKRLAISPDVVETSARVAGRLAARLFGRFLDSWIGLGGGMAESETRVEEGGAI